MIEFGPDRVAKLRGALKYSYKSLSPFRKKRLEMQEQYVGAHYGAGIRKPAPMNVFALTINTYARSLYARDPHVKTNTSYKELKPTAAAWELSTNDLLKEIDLESEALLCVVNALMSLGCLKVGMNQVGEVDVDGQLFPIGRPYAKVVDIEDWVHDVCAKRYSDCAFYGDRQRVPLDWAKANPLYDPAVSAELTASDKTKVTLDGGEERVQNLSTGGESNKEEYVEYVDVWDIYLPYENIVVTLADSETINQPLRVEEYQGPNGGPYHVLNYIDVPGNVMPCPPAAHWLDMHYTLNSTWRKLAQQARREKQLLLGADEEDLKTISKANDGEVRKINNPERIKEARFGGPDSQMQGFAAVCRDAASWNAGNLDAIGGLGAQSETLGQDQLIAENSSKQLQALQARTFKWAKGVCEHLAWLQYCDTLHDFAVTMTVGDVEIPTQFTPEERAQADFNLFNIDIEPFSMQPQTPQTKTQAMMQALNVVMPLQPALQQEGKTLIAEQILNDLADNANLHEIKDWIGHVMAPPIEQPQGPQQPPSTKPPVTRREYVRKNVAGSSRSAKDALTMAASSGQSLQPSEQDALIR